MGEEGGFVVVEKRAKGDVEAGLGVEAFEGVVGGEGGLDGSEDWNEAEGVRWHRQGVLLLGLLGVAAVGLFLAWRMDAFSAWGTGPSAFEVEYTRTPSKDDEETGISMTSREGGKGA